MRTVRFCVFSTTEEANNKIRKYEDPLRFMLRNRKSYVDAIKEELESGSFILIEEDVRLDPSALKALEREISKDLLTIHVAPYLLYSYSVTQPSAFWAHRRVNGIDDKGNLLSYPIFTGQKIADYFGFGCIYLPEPVFQHVSASMEKRDYSMQDHNIDSYFSIAAYQLGYKAKVVWEALAYHDHFNV